MFIFDWHGYSLGAGGVTVCKTGFDIMPMYKPRHLFFLSNLNQCRHATVSVPHMCQTVAHGPNLARCVIMFYPGGNIKWRLELARRYYC